MRFVTSARTLVLAALVAATAVIPLARTTPLQAAGNTYVRVLHASPDAPAVEIFVDGKEAVKSLSFPKETAYVTLPAGSHHLQVFPAGAAYSAMGGVINATVPFKANTYYTVAAIGKLKTIKAAVFSIPAMMNSAKAEVWFAHLSPNAPAVDIEAKGAGIVFKNVKFPNRSAMPIVVPGGSYTLIVHPAGKDTTNVLTVPGVKFQADHVYTVYAIGMLGGMGSQKLTAIVSDDTPMAQSSM
jgi:hypothetical protein